MIPFNRILSLARHAFVLVGAATGLCLFAGWLAYRIAFGIALDHERGLAAQRLDGFALSLEATLARHEALPGLLALHPSLLDLLRHPDDGRRVAAANAYLEAAQQGAAVSAAYLIGADGVTLAASNWRLPRGFVGHSYAFRPYFRDALDGGLGRFYGVGVTTGEPGYFIAGPVRDGGRVLGVVVLKVSLDSIEQALAGSGDMLLADADGVVFLAAERRLRYRTLAPLDAVAAERNAQTRQYGGQRIPLLADRPLPSEAAYPLRFALAGETVRERLIQRLYEEGVSNAKVLEVIRRTPRHLFVDEALAHRAYEDTALPIGNNQTISQPYMVARMSELLLEAGPLDKVMEIGTGSGYQTAVLSQDRKSVV